MMRYVNVACIVVILLNQPAWAADIATERTQAATMGVVTTLQATTNAMETAVEGVEGRE